MTGVRLSYDKRKGVFGLYANDFIGNPSPLLIELAKRLMQGGVKITIINYQGSTTPPNPEDSRRMIKEFNETLK